MNFRNMTGETLGRAYDMVVRATGWNHNTSIYGASATPMLQSNGKFVSDYQLENVHLCSRFHLTGQDDARI